MFRPTGRVVNEIVVLVPDWQNMCFRFPSCHEKSMFSLLPNMFFMSNRYKHLLQKMSHDGSLHFWRTQVAHAAKNKPQNPTLWLDKMDGRMDELNGRNQLNLLTNELNELMGWQKWTDQIDKAEIIKTNMIRYVKKTDGSNGLSENHCRMDY